MPTPTPRNDELGFGVVAKNQDQQDAHSGGYVLHAVVDTTHAVAPSVRPKAMMQRFAGLAEAERARERLHRQFPTLISTITPLSRLPRGAR